MIQVLEIVAPVFGIILLAYVYGRFRPADMSTANRLNVNIFTPALIFFVLSEKLGGELPLGNATFGAIAIVLGSGVIMWPIARAAKWSMRVVLPPVMFNNCGNMGLPLALFAFGEEGLAIAVVMFVISNMLHFTVGLRIFAGHTDLRQLFGNPMVLATMLGVLFMALDLHAPALILPGIEMLGDVAIPLMLFALGMRLTDIDLTGWRTGLVIGLLSPATGLAVALPWVWLFQPTPVVTGVLILFGALPPAVLNYILAEHYDREPSMVASIVALGNAASLIVLPVTLGFVVD